MLALAQRPSGFTSAHLELSTKTNLSGSQRRKLNINCFAFNRGCLVIRLSEIGDFFLHVEPHFRYSREDDARDIRK